MIVQQDQVGYILWMQSWYNIHKSRNVIYHINKIKDKNHLIISIDTKTAFDKIEHSFIIKKSYKNGNRRNIPQHNKGHI